MPQSERAHVFLETVCEQVRWRQAHETIRSDLSAHIEDQEDALLQSGFAQSEAQKRAVAEMGDPVEIGLQLDASYRPGIAIAVVLPLGLLALLGVLLRLFVYTLTPGQWGLFGIALVVGSAGFYALLRLNLYRSLRYAWWLAGAFILLALILPAIAERMIAYHNQSGYWRVYYIAKYLWLLLPPVYGLLVYRMRGTGFAGVLLCCLLFAVPVGLYMRLVFSSYLWESIGALGCFAVLITAILQGSFGCNRWIAFAVVALGAAFCVFLFGIAEPYRASRILSVLNPQRDPNGDGFLILRVREIVSNCVWFGRGETLPEQAAQAMEFFQSNTESRNYVLTMLMHRYGIALMLLPVGTIATFIVFSVRRIRRVGSTLGKILVAGIVAVFFSQAVFSIIACLGYPLWDNAFFPFLSFDSAAFCADLLLAGALTSLLQSDTLFHDKAYRRRKLRVRFDLV